MFPSLEGTSGTALLHDTTHSVTVLKGLGCNGHCIHLSQLHVYSEVSPVCNRAYFQKSVHRIAALVFHSEMAGSTFFDNLWVLF